MIRSLEVIGEAIRGVSPATRARHPAMAGCSSWAFDDCSWAFDDNSTVFDGVLCDVTASGRGRSGTDRQEA